MSRRRITTAMSCVLAMTLAPVCAWAQQAASKPVQAQQQTGFYVNAVKMKVVRDRDPPLTEPQKIIRDLPPAEEGGFVETTPPGSNEPTPSADPRDLRGVWYHNQHLEVRNDRDKYGKLIPYSMAGALVVKRRVDAKAAKTPYLNAANLCRPPGPVWNGDIHMPFAVFQNDKAVEFMFMNYRGRWDLALDASLLPAGPSYMGKSVAHWDGNTLVAETSDFKQPLWLGGDGAPVSTAGRLEQRIRKVDHGDGKPILEIETTVFDPKYYTAPWTLVRSFAWQPNMVLFDEYNCEEQLGDPSVSNDAGLIPEPSD